MVAAPFNGLLAEKVEAYLTGIVPVDRGISATIRDVPRVIGRQLSIIFYYLPRALAILLLYFIPIVQGFAVVIWFLFSAWFLALQFIDFPTDNHRIPVAQVRAWLEARRFATWGFGISLLLVMSLPVLNFFAIPAAVAGATKFWVEEN